VGSNGVDGSMWFNYPQNKMILRGSELILVFHLLPPPVVPNGDVACGTYIIEGGDSSRPAREAWIIAFDLATGIESSKKENSSYQIFPNPSDGVLNIKNTRPTGRALKLQISDAEGRPVKEIRYTDQEKNSFSIETLPNGIYNVSIFKGRHLLCSEKVILKTN